MNVLTPENSLLLIIDVQEKLVNALDKDIIVKRVSNLVKSAWGTVLLTLRRHA